jgi:hypothetical protein
MRFNNHESHRTGKKLTKNVDKLIADHSKRIISKPDAPKPHLWEIMFPRNSGRQPMLSDDPDVKLDQFTQPETVFENLATAASDRQSMSASVPDDDPEDRAAWAASQAAAEDEWAMSQVGAVEGRMGEYGGPRFWSED